MNIGDKHEGVRWVCNYDKNGELRSHRSPNSFENTILHLILWPSGDLGAIYTITDYITRVYFSGTRSWE